MCVFAISVFPECCRTRWGDSRLSEERRLLHLRASAQVPHRFSQGGGAEAGPVVRLVSLPDPTPKSPLWGQEHVQLCAGLVLVQFRTPTPHFNEIYWHLVWEGDPVPLDGLRSQSSLWPFLACGFLLSDLLNGVVLYWTPTEPHTHTHPDSDA